MDGLADLKRKIDRVSKVAQPVLKAEVDWEAKDLVKRMKRIAPRGKTEHLAASVREEPGPHELAKDVKAGGPLTTKPVRNSKKGNAPNYDYANAAEFGREGQPADPFFFPTVRTRRKTFKRRRSTALNKAVKAAVS